MDSDPTAVLRSETVQTPAKPSVHHVSTTTKSKDGAPSSNNKKRNATPPVASKAPAKKVKTNDNKNTTSITATIRDMSNTHSEEHDNKPTYQKVKEGKRKRKNFSALERMHVLQAVDACKYGEQNQMYWIIRMH